MATGERYFLFSLTVSELGFILFFIMVIITIFEISARDEEILETSSRLKKAERSLLVRKELTKQLEKIVGSDHKQNLDDIVVRLEKSELIKQENENLKERVSQLTEKNEASKAFEKLLSSSARNGKNGVEQVTKDIRDIEAAKEVIEKANPDSTGESLLEQVKSLVQQVDDAKRQVAYVRSQGRGIDYPPCWLIATNKAEYTFVITVFANSDVKVEKRDLPHREKQYAKLPSYPNIIASTLDREMFERLALPILEESKSNDCRYYAQVRFDSVEACRFQFVVDKYFYPYVAPSDRLTCTG